MPSRCAEHRRGMELVTSMSPKIEYVSMNQKVEPFNNPLVRQAINYAIDRDSLNLVATNGYGEVTDSVMNKQINGYTDDVTHYEYNPEKAKELLAQAGYPTASAPAWWWAPAPAAPRPRSSRATWPEIGINMEITTMESTTCWSRSTTATMRCSS